MSEFIQAILFPCLLLLIAYAVAEIHQQRASGWIGAWAFLTGMGALFRFLVGVVPEASDGIARGLIFFFAMASLVFLWRSKRRIFARQNRFSVVVYLLFGLVFLHNLFPQIDVDSIAYHHNAMLWLRYREHLPPELRDLRLTDLRFRFIGTEEFLLLPGMGKELMFYGGVLGGVLKWLTCLSVLSMFPVSWALPRLLSLFLILIDDHFFFSGVTTFVYINPAFIGMVALGTWAAWKCLRGRTSLAPMAIAIGVCAAADKMYGLYFLLVFGLAVGLSLFRGWNKYLPRKNWRRDLLVLALSGAGMAALYGTNFVETGTPFYPFPLGPFHSDVIYPAHFENFNNAKPFLTYLKQDHYRLVTYPGNLALKLVVVTLIPLLFFRLGQGWLRRAASIRINKRFLDLAIAIEVTAVLWSLLLAAMLYEEQRYHGRYARQFLGIACLGIGYAVMSFRTLIPKPWKRVASFAVLVLGLVTAWRLISTVDTRYFNIVDSQRVSWPEIIRFLTKDQNSRAIAYPPYDHLLEPFSQVNLKMLEKCFQGLSGGRFALTQPEPDPKLGVVFYNIPKSWAGSFFMPLAPRVDSVVSVANGVPPEGIDPWRRNAGIRYLISRTSDFGPLESNPLPGWDLREALLSRVQDVRPICRSNSLAVFRLAD